MKPPKLVIECVEDLYTLYVLVYNIDSEVFWDFPIWDVERIFENKSAYDSWAKNPMM